MKIRSGFVSNSSSSSFCIIGVTDGICIDRLVEAEGKYYGNEMIMKKVSGCKHKHTSKFCPECGSPRFKEIEVEVEKEPDYLSYGSDEGKVVMFYGDDKPNYVGLPAEALLEDMSLKEARLHFQTLIKKKLNVDIPIDRIGLHYGESGNG